MIRTHSISYGRQLWLGALATLALGFFAFAPSTLAATTLSPEGTLNSTFELYKGTSYSFPVEATNNTLDTNVTLKVTPPGNLVIATSIETHKFLKNGGILVPGNNPYTFTWDGKLNGTYVAPGTYKLTVSGTDADNVATNILSQNITVTGTSKVTVTNAPTTWNKSLGIDYKLDYKVEESVPPCVVLVVSDEVTQATTALNDGSYTRTWNGKINGQMAAVGDYNWKLYADKTICATGSITGLTPVGSGTIKVTENPIIVIDTPKITNFGASINPFSPNNDNNQDTTTISFNLNTTAEVTMMATTTQDVELKKIINGVSKTAGTVSGVWDGKDSNGNVVSDGNYRIVVIAKNASATTDAIIGITVDNPNVISNTETCAGFTDLTKNYADCTVVTWVKNEGIMTGNADGSFDPNGILQRDEVAKISLETFNLFDKNKDYCGGKSAFPDVSKSAWSYQYLCRGMALGMITGYKSGVDAGKYVPGRGVSRVEAYALIFRNLADAMPGNNEPSYKDVPLNEWFTGFAKYAMDHSLFSGSYLYPNEQVTRLEMAKNLYKLDQQNEL